jgi:hypothetical protein
MLDLSDPLLGDTNLAPHLVQRVELTVPHARPHPQDVSNAVVHVEKLGLAEGVERRRPQLA